MEKRQFHLANFWGCLVSLTSSQLLALHMHNLAMGSSTYLTASLSVPETPPFRAALDVVSACSLLIPAFPPLFALSEDGVLLQGNRDVPSYSRSCQRRIYSHHWRLFPVFGPADAWGLLASTKSPPPPTPHPPPPPKGTQSNLFSRDVNITAEQSRLEQNPSYPS
jgi:hypothetical protein